MFNDELPDLKVLFHLRPNQICFSKLLPLTFKFLSQMAGGVFVYPFVSALLIEGLHHLNLWLTVFLYFDLEQGQMWLVNQRLKRVFIKSFLIALMCPNCVSIVFQSLKEKKTHLFPIK